MAEVDCWTKRRDEDVARCSQETQFICGRGSVVVTRYVHWEGFFSKKVLVKPGLCSFQINFAANINVFEQAYRILPLEAAISGCIAALNSDLKKIITYLDRKWTDTAPIPIEESGPFSLPLHFLLHKMRAE